MSKLVKNIISEDLKKRLDGVENALLVNVIGMGVNDSNRLRKELVSKGINLLVVKNSLARRALTGSKMDGLFTKEMAGSTAVCWGMADIVSLAKEIVKIGKEKSNAKMQFVGGILDGEAFSADMVVQISKWPSREEQISIVLGQIVGVGAGLSSQLLSCGASLASQIKQLFDKETAAEETVEETAA